MSPDGPDGVVRPWVAGRGRVPAQHHLFKTLARRRFVVELDLLPLDVAMPLDWEAQRRLYAAG